MQPDDPGDGDLQGRIGDALRERAEVAFAYLHGSRAGGPARRSSDVDVAVYLRDGEQQRRAGGPGGEARDGSAQPAGSPGDWTEIHGALVRSLGGGADRGGAPQGVDLVLLNRAPPLLSERVLRRGDLLFSRDEPARIRWMVRTKSRYCDLRRAWERLDRVVAERLRSGEFGRPAPEADGR